MRRFSQPYYKTLANLDPAPHDVLLLRPPLLSARDLRQMADVSVGDTDFHPAKRGACNRANNLITSSKTDPLPAEATQTGPHHAYLFPDDGDQDKPQENRRSFDASSRRPSFSLLA